MTGRQEVHRLCRMLTGVERAEREDFEELLEASDDEGNVSEEEEAIKKVKRKGRRKAKAKAKAKVGSEAQVRSEEMPELSFAVGEEDVLVLEDEVRAEDAKDIELRNQRKVRMSRRFWSQKRSKK